MEHKAIIINRVTGVEIEVVSTTNHPASSYGQPVWVDKDNNAYCQVGLENPLYSVKQEFCNYGDYYIYKNIDGWSVWDGHEMWGCKSLEDCITLIDNNFAR